jgi:hypothetical protein
VAHKIKELNDVKIIMITAYQLNHELVRDLKENEYVIDILEKSIAIDSLMAKVLEIKIICSVSSNSQDLLEKRVNRR